MATSRNRYVLFKKIARGGMAEIFLGKQMGEDGFQRICCIKRILPHYAGESEFVEMFRDEAHICKRLQHANIVRVEGFEEVEGSYAIIMEFIDGADVRAVLSACEKKGQRLTIPMCIYLIAEAARGLHYAHTKVDEITNKALEIVHRDISPQNLLVSFEGEVKVTDFGIADADSKATETKPGIVKGKYSYMSPEQISAKPVDARTDVFALAIVLWEMIAMKRLFQGENEVATIQMVKNCRIDENIRNLNSDVDEELSGILDKGLKKETKDRYASAAAFEKDLRRYLNQKYPSFTSEDLGNFIKNLLDQKRQESIANIKQLLSTDNLGATKADLQSSVVFSLEKGIEHVDQGNKSRSQSLIQPIASIPVASVASIKLPVQEQQKPKQPATPQFYQQTRTGLNNPSFQTKIGYTNTGVTKTHSKRSSNNSLSYVVVVLAAMILLAGGYMAFKKIQKSKLPSTLEIRTTPSIVKVVFDGVAVEGGAYIKTPLVIKKVAKGDHTLTFSRPGFSDETIALSVEAASQVKRDDIVLKQTKKMAPVRLTFQSVKKQETRIVIDDGLMDEVIASTETANIDNITFGDDHMLTVYPTGSEPFKCQFVPRSQNWRQPYLIQVVLRDRLCLFPEKL